jgi:hypothetical protein
LIEQGKNHQEGVASQLRVEKIDDQTDQIISDFKSTLIKIENTKIYNEQLKKVIENQTNEMISIKEQIKNLKDTHQGIVPLMVRMVNWLENFVLVDVPFLTEERTNRVEKLKELTGKADISTSEKYRRVLEAFQIEIDYGSSIEAYKGILDGATVEFLRVGRIGLYYQTLDGKTSGIWDKNNQKWNRLDNDFNQGLLIGIKMAKKQIAPDLIKVPFINTEKI